MTATAMSADDTIFAFRRNVVVVASAGTGKTFRLVTLHTLLLLGLTSMGQKDDETAAPPLRPERIAATTFSRAAAAEIRTRLEKVLLAVASGSFDDDVDPSQRINLPAYRRILAARAEQTGQPPIDSPVMRERAQAALNDLSAGLIDTLHGLAASLVRSSAWEIGVPADFTIVDEDDARQGLAFAVDDALTAALGRGDGAALDLLAAAGGLRRAREQVARLLERLDDEGIPAADLDVSNIADDATRLVTELSSHAKALANEGGRRAEIAAQAARALAPFADGAVLAVAGDQEKSARDLANALAPLLERVSRAPSDQALGAFIARSFPKWTRRQCAERLAALAVHAPRLSAATLAARHIIADASHRLDRLRRGSGRLGFGDVLRLARDAVRDDPTVAARARATFDALLVDELQDTSRVQRDLVYLLRESNDSARRRPVGTLPAAIDLAASGLLVVGDRKQSIYAFRGADVGVFTRVCVELAGDRARVALDLPPSADLSGRAPPTISPGAAPATIAGAPKADLVALAENRRSHPSILEFVNRFASRDFAVDEKSHPDDIRYAAAEHLVPAPPIEASQKPVGGHAAPPATSTSSRVLVIDDDLDASSLASLRSDDDLRHARGPLGEARLAALVVDRLVTHPGNALDLGTGLPRVGFGDIAILSRRRQLLPLLEYTLGRHQIPFALAGRALFATREAHDVLGLLRLLVDPSDRHALATVLRGPAFGASDATLALLSEPGRGLYPPWAWFSPISGDASGRAPADRVPPGEARRLALWVERLESLRHIGASLGAGDALRAALAELDVEAVWAALPRGAQTLGNVERIVAMAWERGGGVAGFTRWLGARIADETDESEAAVSDGDEDAVRLMTVHGSKGLEFGVVILVDLAWTPRTIPTGIAMSRAGNRPSLVVRHKTREGAPLPLPAAMAHLDDERRRDIAERRRLTYVALTRAKDLLILINPNLDDRTSPVEKKAPLGSALLTLRSFAPSSSTSPDLGAPAPEGSPVWLRASSWLDIADDQAPSPEPASETAQPPIAEPIRRPPPRRLTLATTPLATFDDCPRRYQLTHLIALDAPVGAAPWKSSMVDGNAPDPRDLGTLAHAWLERSPTATWGVPLLPGTIADGLQALAQPSLLLGGAHATNQAVATKVARFIEGAYAGRIARTGQVGREVPFVLALRGIAPSAPTTLPSAASSQYDVSLRGKIDLLVRWPDGSADVIDYKLSRRSNDLSAHGFQLRTYALAAVRRFGVRSVRAGIVFLDGSDQSAEPVFLDPPPQPIELAAHEARLGELALRLARARWEDHFEPVPVPRCRKLACGFVASCHPKI